MITNYKKIEVNYNNKLVGYLAEIADKIAFQYDDEWIENGFSISPFSLPLSNTVYISSSPYFNGLFGVFADSLPDGWGELLLIRMLNKNDINPNQISPLTKLTLINSMGLGGLTYSPTQSNNSYDDNNINVDKISVLAQEFLNSQNVIVNFDKLYELGVTTGGSRPKVHIKIDSEDWIVKFPSFLDPPNICEQEFHANLVAKKCGLNVPDFRLLPSKICTGYFATKRFDRNERGRVHTISLSSLLETSHLIPNLDYKHLFQMTQAICYDVNELYEVFRRMCFNVLYDNKDDHGKNFSFIYDEKLKKYSLSPAYDLTSVPEKYEHEMTINGKGQPSKQDLFELAKSFGLKSDICNNIYTLIEETIIENKI